MMEDKNMCSKANTQVAVSEKRQRGCCCNTSAGAPKSTVADTQELVAAQSQTFLGEEDVGARSKACCGGH
jgi:hypothetical protein